MTKEDWKEIRELRTQFMGESKGLALGNLIAEQQRLEHIRKIVKDYDGSFPSMVKQFSLIQKVLEREKNE